jgi:hypothetical protein
MTAADAESAVATGARNDFVIPLHASGVIDPGRAGEPPVYPAKV